MAISNSLLLVDDDQVFLDVLKLRFTRLGYHVVATSHPREALEAMCAEPFQVALIDVGFADASGLELIQPLRNSIGSPAVVVISGYTDPESMTRAKQNGAAAYLVKPCGLASIEVAVAKAVTTRGEASSDPVAEVVG